MEGYESYVDSVSLSLFQRQTYLKDEVLRQRRAQYELIEQIKSQTALKHLFERQISTEKDPRRQVRQLPTFMDCKSDIKITIR